MGKDGKQLTCHSCGSTEHFKRDCPQGSSAPSFHTSTASSSNQKPKPWETQGDQPRVERHKVGFAMDTSDNVQDDDWVVMGGDDQWGNSDSRAVHTVTYTKLAQADTTSQYVPALNQEHSDVSPWK